MTEAKKRYEELYEELKEIVEKDKANGRHICKKVRAILIHSLGKCPEKVADEIEQSKQGA